jgi:integrase
MAGRVPRPWFCRGKGAWYVILDGRTIRLDKDRDNAHRAFHRLMADRGPVSTAAPPTFRRLAELYLADLKARVTGRTYYVASCYLKPILTACGDLRADAVKRPVVEAAIRAHGRWSPTTENHVKCRVVALFRWAVDQEFLATNPVRGIRKPPARSRGSDALIRPEDHARLMAGAPAYLRDILLALYETGARPCEVLTVTAADFHPDQALWVLQSHKTSYRVARPRVVYLTPAVVELSGRLAARHPTGPLFRRASEKPFPPAYYLARLLRDLCRRLGVRKVTPYGYRHSWATDALAKGVPDAHVAELLGHSGTAMLHKHYSHLTDRARALKDALGRVRG